MAGERIGWLISASVATVLAVLAIGVAIGEQGRFPDVRSLDAVGVALLLGGTLPVVMSRRWPLAAYLVTLISIGTYQAMGYTINSPYFLGLLFTAYAAPKADRRWESAGLALLALPISAVGAAVRGHLEAMYVLPLPILTAAAFIAGQVASELRAASAARDARTREAEQQRMLTEERLRIARELHDVISHSIATIGVQAGVAAHVWDQQPEQAREALLTIKDLSRDALRDLRGMLRVLRQSDDDADREPAPGLSRVPELLDRVRAGGMVVELQVEGTARPLTPATDLAAYRAVQEALTNVIRHAPGASAEVRVQYADDSVRVDVTDDGGAQETSTVSGAGLGLSGLRERATALGGTLDAGPTGSHGFRVSMSLPTGTLT
jgi:signal transduction histidine kinase